eukprot:3077470-Ditylum_brightwellii.AAC.1
MSVENNNLAKAPDPNSKGKRHATNPSTINIHEAVQQNAHGRSKNMKFNIDNNTHIGPEMDMKDPGHT